MPSLPPFHSAAIINNCARVVCSGNLSYTGLVKCLDRVLELSRGAKGIPSKYLIHFSNITENNLTSDDVWQYTERCAALGLSCPLWCALVADQPAIYGTCRMMASANRNALVSYETFENMEAAEAWLETRPSQLTS